MSGRPPGIAGDILRIRLAGSAVDDSPAPFVLNHFDAPQTGLKELARVTRQAGAVLASVFGTENRSAARDRIDAVAGEHGFTAPAWYLQMKSSCVPLLGSAASMAVAATEAGLRVLLVEEGEVDVGVTRSADLVDYRLGQAHYSDWLAGLDDARKLRLRQAALEAVGAGMPPYRPLVVHLVALVED